MHLVTYSHDGKNYAGLLIRDSIAPLLPFGFADTMDFLSASDEVRKTAAIDATNAPLDSRLPLASVKLLAPVLKPAKILCIGLNYRDHAAESKMDVKAVPTVFAKYSSSITGPDAPIILPKLSEQADYEAELAIVIGKQGKNIPVENWEEYVFGYTILNDVSARDVQLATSQWTLGKSFDTFCPIGPSIVSTDELRNPGELDIKLTIGNEVLQHSNTRYLIYDIPYLVAYLSSIVPLEPGDIISTGTPEGVGLGRTPKRWLKPGEEVVIEIEGIGSLRNTTVAE